MYILGLTGGMASGKSTVSGFLRACGAVIVDADKIVHDLQKAGTAQTLEISKKLGTEVLDKDGNLSRPALAKAIEADKSVLTYLESVLHPAVRKEEARLLQEAFDQGAEVAVLDIPLLFETNAHLLCDGVAVCHSQMNIRKERAFKRRGMTEAKWTNLLARRWDDAKMLNHADFVIDTNVHLDDTNDQVRALYEHLSREPATAWVTKWA